MSVRKDINEVYTRMYSNVVRSLVIRQIVSITVYQVVVTRASDTTRQAHVPCKQAF